MSPFQGPITESGINFSVKLFNKNPNSKCIACSCIPHNCHPDWLLRYDCKKYKKSPIKTRKLDKIIPNANIMRSQDLGILYFPHGSIQIFNHRLFALDSKDLLYFAVDIPDDAPFFITCRCSLLIQILGIAPSDLALNYNQPRRPH